MFRILVVCTGNICRSPMGEGILKALLARHGLSDQVEVRSCGTWATSGDPASRNGVLAAARHGIDLQHHRSASLSRALIRDADLLLVMEPTHLEEVLAQDPQAEEKAFVLTTFADPEEGDPGGVEDPIGGDPSAYEATFEQLDHLMRVALPRILSRVEQAGVAERIGEPETEPEAEA